MPVIPTPITDPTDPDYVFTRGDDPFAPLLLTAPPDDSAWAELESIPESTDAFQPATNIVQVEMLYLWQGQVVENVFHVYRALGWAGQDLGALGNIFKAWHSTHLRTTQCFGTILNQIEVRDLTTSTGGRASLAVTESNGGTIGSFNEAANVSFAIKWSGSVGGRNAIGRTFHVGLCEAWVQDSIVDENAANLILEKYNTLLSLVNVNSQRLVVCSRWFNKVKRPVAVPYGILYATYTDRVVDSMRRRLPGRGR